MICIISYWWFYLFLIDDNSPHKFRTAICYLLICFLSFNVQVSSCFVKMLRFYEIKSVNVFFWQFLHFCVLIKVFLFRDKITFLFSFNGFSFLLVYIEDFDPSRMYFRQICGRNLCLFGWQTDPTPSLESLSLSSPDLYSLYHTPKTVPFL